MLATLATWLNDGQVSTQQQVWTVDDALNYMVKRRRCEQKTCGVVGDSFQPPLRILAEQLQFPRELATLVLSYCFLACRFKRSRCDLGKHCVRNDSYTIDCRELTNRYVDPPYAPAPDIYEGTVELFEMISDDVATVERFELRSDDVVTLIFRPASGDKWAFTCVCGERHRHPDCVCQQLDCLKHITINLYNHWLTVETKKGDRTKLIDDYANVNNHSPYPKLPCCDATIVCDDEGEQPIAGRIQYDPKHRYSIQHIVLHVHPSVLYDSLSPNPIAHQHLYPPYQNQNQNQNK
jgi:hypothetical protein